MCNDTNQEMQMLQKALEKAEIVCGQFNIELYSIRGKLMAAYLLNGIQLVIHELSLFLLTYFVNSIMDLGDHINALQICYEIVGFLYFSLSNIVPFHPLLGLQLYTLGNLIYSSFPVLVYA